VERHDERSPHRPRPVLRTLVGAALRRNRLGQRRTLADVARAARVSVPYLSEVERGRKEASSEVLGAVCDALRIDLSDLLAEVWLDLVGQRTNVVPLNAARQHRAESARRPSGALGRPAPGRGDVVLLAA
jgi:transcriptional regulator with XRE-family HTH domain